MNLDHYCPAQSSIDRYCAALGEDETFDMAVDNRKDELMKHLTPELIIEALAELPQRHELWRNMGAVIKQVHNNHDATLRCAHALIGTLTGAVEAYAEKEALRQIMHERDNPDPAQEDNGDDYR